MQSSKPPSIGSDSYVTEIEQVVNEVCKLLVCTEVRDNLWEIVLYSSTLEVLGIELRPSGLAASTFNSISHLAGHIHFIWTDVYLIQ